MKIKEVKYIRNGILGFFKKPLICVNVFINDDESKKPSWEISSDVQIEGRLNGKEYMILSILPENFYIDEFNSKEEKDERTKSKDSKLPM